MEEVKKYSAEWFVSHCSKDQQKEIEKAAKGSKKIEKDVPLRDTVFEGKVDDVKKRIERGTSLNYSQKEAIKKIGVDKLLSIMDADNDGMITSDEIQDVAMADGDEFDLKALAVLSTNDIKTIYENAQKAKKGSVEKGEDREKYSFKDGSFSTVLRDTDGKILSYTTTEKAKGDEQTSTTYIYESQTKQTTTKNLKTNDSVTIVDEPGQLNDRTITSKNNQDGTKTITTETIGKTVETLYDSKGNKITSKIESKVDSDGVISFSKQQGYGDCWLLASLNALKDTEIGKKLIKQSVIHNSNGDITVYLKGVKKHYTFTPEQIIQTIENGKKQGKKYAEGDVDVVLFELAVQKFRKEEEHKTLDSGTMDEGFKIITGQSSLVSVLGIAEPFMLDAKRKNPEKYALIAAFKGADYSVSYDIEDQHAYSISRVDKNTVYIVNPHDSSKEIAYPIDKFKKNCIALSSVNLEKIK